MTIARHLLRRLRGDALRIALTAGALALAADTADRHLTHLDRPVGTELLRGALRLAAAARPPMTP